jgi:hypothetical protein
MVAAIAAAAGLVIAAFNPLLRGMLKA